MLEVTERADNPVAQRSKIIALQAAMRELPQIQEELSHHFCDGLYGREMRVPAGTILVGKTHRKACFNFILEGVVEVRAPEGAFRVEAPHFFISPAKTKRAMVALTDLVWMTVHPSNETDLINLEDELIDDHAEFLAEHGFTEEIARIVSETPYIECEGPFVVLESRIQGLGIFANLKAGEALRAAIDGQKTTVGRYTNHSSNPNARVVKIDGRNIDFVALKDIDGEVTVNYREVLA